MKPPPLTELMSTLFPCRAASIMGSKPLAARSKDLACSRSFFCLACSAAFWYCFLRPSRNSSCWMPGSQRVGLKKVLLYKNRLLEPTFWYQPVGESPPLADDLSGDADGDLFRLSPAAETSSVSFFGSCGTAGLGPDRHVTSD